MGFVGAQTAETAINRWATALWGVCAVALGLLLAIQPAVTAVFLVQVLAVFWLVGGAIDLAAGLVDRGHRFSVWRIVEGLVAIIAGILLLGNPFVGVALVVFIQVYLIAFAALVNGVINIVGRFQGVFGWGRVVLGFVQLAVAGLLLFNPIPAVLAVLPTFGILVALGGLITIAAALFLRSSPGRAGQPA